MEPIPLRVVTVLLNYERMISDPRFKNELLVNTSINEPSTPRPFDNALLPPSVQ